MDKKEKDYLNMMCLIHLYADVQEYAYYDLGTEDRERLFERIEERKELAKEINDDVMVRVVNSMFEEIDNHINRKGGEII